MTDATVTVDDRIGADAALRTHLVGPGEMSGTATEILRAWLDDGAPPGSIAVLARVNSALLPIQVALGVAGIPRTTPLDQTVLNRTGIRTALAYLRLGLDTERIQRADVYETINRPSRRVKGAIQPFLKRDRRWSMSRLRGLADTLDGKNGDRLHGYCDDLALLSDAITDGADTGECFAIIRDRIGLGEAMDVLDSSTTRPEGSSHGDDLDALAQLADLHVTPVTFAEWLAGSLRIPGDENGVVLSTVHRVKGMEWDHVVVFAANDGLFPHRLADDIEEERRIFHVALTRCCRGVAVVGTRDTPSPFIAELTDPGEHGGTTPGDGPPPEPRAATFPADGTLLAEPGVTVTVAGGFTGTIVEVTPRAVWARTDDGIELELAVGEEASADGRAGRLIPPLPKRPAASRHLAGTGLTTVATDPSAVDPIFEALRAWRRTTAEAQGMPAYIVFPDSTLQGIAERQPRSPRELAGVPGIGPTKLERYGDDVLAIIEELLPTDA